MKASLVLSLTSLLFFGWLNPGEFNIRVIQNIVNNASLILGIPLLVHISMRNNLNIWLVNGKLTIFRPFIRLIVVTLVVPSVRGRDVKIHFIRILSGHFVENLGAN